MKIIDFDSKKQNRDNQIHDSIMEAFDYIKEKLDEDGDKAEAMVCFMKTSEGQYLNSVVVNYGDLVEMIGLVDIMKLTLIDAVGE